MAEAVLLKQILGENMVEGLILTDKKTGEYSNAMVHRVHIG